MALNRRKNDPAIAHPRDPLIEVPKYGNQRAAPKFHVKGALSTELPDFNCVPVILRVNLQSEAVSK